jgi:hypothetical protein
VAVRIVLTEIELVDIRISRMSIFFSR